MGLGWNQKQKLHALGSCVGPAVAHSAEVDVVGDGPAIMRRLLIKKCSPSRVATQFVRMLAKSAHRGTLGGSIVSVFFDRAALMPAARALVSASRTRARPPPAGVVGFDPSVAVPGQLLAEYDWDPILGRSNAKAALWEMLGRSLFQSLCSHRDCTVEVVTANGAYAHKGTAVLPVRDTALYGEADILVARRARELAAAGRSVDVLTIDNDQILQTLLARGTALPSFLTFQGKNANRVNVAQLVERFGGHDRASRLRAAFFLVCGFRTDYSKSLCRPTSTKSAVFIDAMRGDTLPLTERATACGGYELLFWPGAFFQVATRAFRPCEDATALMTSVLWTLAYFAEYGARDPVSAGPPPVTLPEDWQRQQCVVVARDDGPAQPTAQ